MDTVTRHLAVNRVKSNGLLCGRSYSDLTNLESRVVCLPKNSNYGILLDCKSLDLISTYDISPPINLVICKECADESSYKV